MVRLVLASLFFLVSLLCLFPAPTIQLWYVAILAAEFPWIFWIVMLLLLLWGIKVQHYRMAGDIISIITLLIFISPVARAYYAGASLAKDFEMAFGEGTLHLGGNEHVPFSAVRMITGINTPQLPYKTLAYSANADGPLTLDYYRAANGGKRPCLVVVHGGSWSAGDSRQLPELNSYLAGVGYNVATINYGLVPKYRFPVPENDVHATLQYLRAHADELGIDTNNFVLLGRSAGGQIVLAAAYALHENGLKGVIDMYGPADMVWGYAHPVNPLVLNSTRLMEDYLRGTYTQVPQNYMASSGTATVTTASVPTLMIHGQNDPLVPYEHSLRMSKELQQMGVPHFLLTLPWATHGCDYTLNGPAGQLSTYTIERFMHVVTGGVKTQ